MRGAPWLCEVITICNTGALADLNQAADRWPRFVAALARPEPFASVHAVPLRLRGQAIGVLNLLHRDYVRGHNLRLAVVAGLLATRQLDPARILPAPAPRARGANRR